MLMAASDDKNICEGHWLISTLDKSDYAEFYEIKIKIRDVYHKDSIAVYFEFRIGDRIQQHTLTLRPLANIWRRFMQTKFKN